MSTKTNKKAKTTVAVVEQVVVAEVTKQKGRPVNPTSERQVRLASMEEKRQNGELKRGRPIESDSARQIRLAEMEAKREAGELHRGRPVDLTSARQVKLAEMDAKREAGLLKRGRPAKAKSVGTDETVEIAAVEGNIE